jgi:hypothetical protein
MNNALIYVSVFSVVFAISGIFVLLRSNTAVISARSASLLYAFHLGNWLESVFIILIIFRSELQLDHSENIYWFTHLGAGVSHFLVFLPYLLRAYRLYLIFVLETGFDDFCESPLYYRTTQRWLVQVLVLSTAGIFLVYAIFTVLFMTGVVENLLGVDSALISESPYVWILVFLRFLEQLSLILTCNAIKDVENDFNMVSELTLVTIFYTLTPFSALFWHVHQEYLWIFLVRNLLLLCISSIYPVFLSFTQSTSFQMLSIENLYSLELLLLHPEGLSAFENFLKTFKPLTIQEEGDEGSLLLNFLMLIECKQRFQVFERNRKISNDSRN